MSAMKKEAIKLYYLILKAHIQVLPKDLRTLGDAMVKQEFRQHFTGEGKYMTPFVESWLNYYEQMIESNNYKDLGNNMTEDDKKMLTMEQKESLRELKEFSKNELNK